MEMNAFHPDYVKTYEPTIVGFLKQERANKKASESMTKFVENKRRTTPSHGTIVGISKPISQFPKPLSAKERAALAPREFKIFSAAGMPKGKKK